MQKIVATILLISIVGQSFSQVFYYCNYLLDRAAYEKYCVNKQRPALKCKGQCQLMKRIAEEERQQQQAPEMKLASKIELLPGHDNITFTLEFSTNSPGSVFFPPITGSPVDRSADIFHPPC